MISQALTIQALTSQALTNQTLTNKAMTYQTLKSSILVRMCLILCQTEYVSQMCIKLTGNLTTLKNDNCLPTGKTSTSSSQVTKDISPISKRDPIPEKII